MYVNVLKLEFGGMLVLFPHPRTKFHPVYKNWHTCAMFSYFFWKFEECDQFLNTWILGKVANITVDVILFRSYSWNYIIIYSIWNMSFYNWVLKATIYVIRVVLKKCVWTNSRMLAIWSPCPKFWKQWKQSNFCLFISWKCGEIYSFLHLIMLRYPQTTII